MGQVQNPWVSPESCCMILWDFCYFTSFSSPQPIYFGMIYIQHNIITLTLLGGEGSIIRSLGNYPIYFYQQFKINLISFVGQFVQIRFRISFSSKKQAEIDKEELYINRIQTKFVLGHCLLNSFKWFYLIQKNILFIFIDTVTLYSNCSNWYLWKVVAKTTSKML